MVKIYHTKTRPPTFRVIYLDVNGRKIYHDTGIEVKGKEGSRQYETLKRKAEQIEADLKSEVRRGKRCEEEAKKLADSFLGTKFAGNDHPLEDFARYISESNSEGVIYAKKKYIDKFAEFVAPRISSLEEITFPIVQDYVNHLTALKYKKASIQVNLQAMSSTWANIFPGTVNPFKGHRITTPKEDKLQSRIPLTDEQVEILLARLKENDNPLYHLTLLALSTSARLGDCCNLRWENVDLENRTIKITTRKTCAEILIPVSDRLLDSLHELRGSSDSEYVNPKMKAQFDLRAKTITQRLKRHMSSAFSISLDSTFKERYGRHRASVYDFHCLRTTAISRMCRNGLSLDVISKVTGHRNLSVLKNHYNKTSALDFREQITKALI